MVCRSFYEGVESKVMLFILLRSVGKQFNEVKSRRNGSGSAILTSTIR